MNHNQENPVTVTAREGREVAEILSRRANEIAGFCTDNREKMPGSVELALDREMKRLRGLADKLKPAKYEEEE